VYSGSREGQGAQPQMSDNFLNLLFVSSSSSRSNGVLLCSFKFGVLFAFDVSNGETRM